MQVIRLVLSDALREAAGTEVALSNGFRFAPPRPAGPVREADLWYWYPITTRLKVGKATGRQLRALRERETEHGCVADPAKLFGGWLPRPSGMTVRFAAHAPEGQRVRRIRVGGRPLEDDRADTMVACEREGTSRTSSAGTRTSGSPGSWASTPTGRCESTSPNTRRWRPPTASGSSPWTCPPVVRSRVLPPSPGRAGRPGGDEPWRRRPPFRGSPGSRPGPPRGMRSGRASLGLRASGASKESEP